MKGGSGLAGMAAEPERVAHGSGAPSAGGRGSARLWKAIAGMAAALALASAIVSFDVSRQLIQRAHATSRRIAALRKELARREHEAESARARLAEVRKKLSERGLILRVLVAPDLVSLKMVPSTRATKAAATLSISRQMAGAVLNATGLEKLPAGQAYQAWWVSKGASTKVAEFHPQADGSATVYLEPPPQKAQDLQCFVARGRLGQDSSRVTGQVLLQVRLSK